MQRFVNTFNKGIDKDTNVNKYSNENYQDAENIRLIVNEENGNGAVTNLQGISLSGYFVGETIVGTTTVNDKIIIFTKVNSTVGRIYYLTESQLSSPVCLIQKNFSFGDYVEIIARYQNSTTTKIWWVDGINVLRSCNLEEGDATYWLDKDLGYFDIYSNINLPNVVFNGLTGGNLKSGSYQYVYALYSPNKAETVYTNSSTIIPITSSNAASTKLFKGDVNGTVSNKGISISIAGALTANPNYSRIRIARLFYPSKDSVPEVNIVYEGQLSDNVTFNDTGNSLGTLVFEDVTKLPNIFVAKTLETKFDYLFAGNIDEERFDIDIDMRMYQYPESSTSTKYYTSHTSTNGVGELTITPPIYSSIPQEHNLLNLTNVLELDGVSDINNQNKYKYNSLILGGSGIYGEFSFGSIRHTPCNISKIDSNLSNIHPDVSTDDASRPPSSTELYQNLGYQRDEIYRFGIVFTDNKGRTSFVKWITDVRIPQRNIVSGVSPGAACYGINLGIRFTFNSAFTTYLQNNNIVSYQIVRCSRENDGTVIDTGYIAPLRKLLSSRNTYGDNGNFAGNCKLFFNGWDDTASPSSSHLDNTDIKGGGLGPRDEQILLSDDEYFEYLSPTSNYNIGYKKGGRLDIDQDIATSWVTYRTGSVGTYNGVLDGIVTKIIPGRTGQTFTISLRTTILDEKPIQSSENVENTIQLDDNKALSTRILHYYTRDFDERYSYKKYKLSLKGATNIIKLEDNPIIPLNIYGAYCLKRSVIYPYGGYTNAAKSNSTYIPCTDSISINTTTIDVYGGDTFINFFEQLRGFSTNRDGHRNVYIVHAALESKINFTYNTTRRFSNYDTNDSVAGILFTGNSLYYNIHENKGAYSVEGDQIFEQLEDFYGYNSAYTPSVKTLFYPKPLDLVAEYNYPTRVYRSDKKFNSELSDSWSEFKFNNFIDLDNTYGNLTKLILHNNNLIGLQSKAISIISVEPREMIPSEQGSALNVATGGVLDRYDYITNKSGSNFQRSVLSTMHGLYYYDGINKKICRLGEGVEYLSDSKGIQSLIGKANITEFYTLYHPIYKEVWFNYKDTIVKNITYNEYLQAFISRNSIQGEYWFNMNGKVYFLDNVIHNDGFIEANVGIIQLLDADNRRSYTTNVIGEFPRISVITVNDGNSSLTLIINPNNVLVNRFDILELTIDSINEAPVSSLQLDNSYLTSGIITLNDDNFIRRFRTYRFNQMRGITESDGTEPRFIDTHLKVKLNFTNTDDLIKFYDVITTFEPLKLNAIK